MRKLKLLLLLTIFASFSLWAQDGSTPIPVDSNVKVGQLDNGLKYYIRQNAKPEDKVELRLVVNAGSILEDEDQRGLAHFMEHMSFNGTTNFKKNDLVDYLQSIGVKFGAHLNAYTSFDETVYILPIPSDDPEKLEKGFQIIEDWAHNALLEGQDIDDERGVVLEELRLRQGADDRMMQKYLPKLLYGSKYVDRLPIGTKENLETFDYESIRRFYKDWYRPDLMAVIAVGDADVSVLEEKIKEHFGKIKNPDNEKERKVFDLPNHDETFIAIESDPEAAFSQVQVVYKDNENAKEDETLGEYRHSILESLFSQMINNRLEELRNSANPPFVFGYSYYGGTYARTKNAYQSIAQTSEDGQLTALKALLEENERVKRYGFNQGEFERAKKDILAGLEKSYNDRDKTNSSRFASEYIRSFLENEPIPGIEWEYNFHKAVLPSIQLDEINKLIGNYLKDTNRVIVITGPEKEGLKKATEAEVKSLLETVEKEDLKPYEDKEVAASLITGDLPKPGKVESSIANETIGTTTITLSNGATVTYKKTDFKNDEILFSAYSYGGTSLFSDEDFKATAYASSGLAEAGVNNFSKTDLDKILTGKIVSVRPSIGSYSEGFSGSASPKDLEELFQLTYLYFTALNKDQEAYNSFINKQKAFLGNIMANPQFYFQIELSKFLNEASPRFMGFPTPEDLDNSDYDLAYEKYQERFKDAGDFHFYFVGNIDENKLIEYATKYIGSLPSYNSNEKYVVTDFRPLSGSHEKVFEKGKDPKSSVRIIYQGNAEYDPKEALIMETIGEVLTIKLIEKLREEEGGVYGVGASGSIRKTPYGWYNMTISFPCGPENVEKLKAAALAQVETLINDGPTSEDLAKVKENLLLDRKEDLKDNRFWLNLLKDADYENENAGRVLNYDVRVSELTQEDLKKVAQKYLTKGHITAIHNPEP